MILTRVNFNGKQQQQQMLGEATRLNGALKRLLLPLLLLLVVTHATTTTTLAQQQQQQQQQQQFVNNSAAKKSSVCQVFNGESVAILEITESNNSDFSQATIPLELPITGSVERNEIELKIESEQNKLFELRDKRLILVKPLDRDATVNYNNAANAATNSNGSNLVQKHPISSIYLQLSCIDKRVSVDTSKQQSFVNKTIIPVLIKVIDLNDNAPKFSRSTFQFNVDELSDVNSIVVNSELLAASDADVGNNALIDYSLHELSATTQASDALLPFSANAQQHAPSPQPQHKQHALKLLPLTTTTTTTSNSIVNNKLVTTATPLITSTATTTQSTNNSSQQQQQQQHQTINEQQAFAFELARQSQLTPTTTTSTPTAELDTNKHQINFNSRRSAFIISEPTDDQVYDDASLANFSPLKKSVVDKSFAVAGSSSIDSQQQQQQQQQQRRRKKRFIESDASTLQQRQTTIASQTTAFTKQQQLLLKSASTPRYSPLDYFKLAFPVNSQRPVLVLKRKLDFETRRSHSMLLVARDRGNPALESSVVIIVHVLDNDDLPPAFIVEQSASCVTQAPQLVSSTIGSTTAAATTNSPFITTSNSNVAMRAQNNSNSLKNFFASDLNLDFGDSSTLTTNSSVNSIVNNNNNNNYNKQQVQVGCQLLNAPQQSNQLVEYSASVAVDEQVNANIQIFPQAIKAFDLDELNAPIKYSFVNGSPANFNSYFELNSNDGSVKLISPFDVVAPTDKFEIYVRAQEQTVRKLSSLAKLTIEVIASSAFKPLVLRPNSYIGFVNESAQVGSRVFITSNVNDNEQTNSNEYKAMRINAFDASSNQQLRLSSSSSSTASARFTQLEFESSSNAFKVDCDGFVYVNEPLADRDLPGAQHWLSFQVTARQTHAISGRQVETSSSSSSSSSSPILLNVTLLNIDDNAPAFNAQVSAESPLRLLASTSARNTVRLTQVHAFDVDEQDGKCALEKCRFSIFHASNNASARFRIDPVSGALDALGKFSVGEQFSLTLQVCDDLTRCSRVILEIIVERGPNVSAPHFVYARDKHIGGYQAHISESLAINSPVIQVHAIDLDGDEQIAYSLVDGNKANHFSIDSRSGLLSVAQKLDREEIGAYSLHVQARDSGGLATTTVVSITLLDVNDMNPVFSSQVYEFEVDECTDNNNIYFKKQLIGNVRATDADLNENARLTYSLTPLNLVENSNDSNAPLFSISPETGDLFVERALDFESSSKHLLLVTATDNGEQPRKAHARIVIRVRDCNDELPFFDTESLHVNVDENVSNASVAQVFARDLDSFRNVTYTLKSSSPRDLNSAIELFRVDPVSGRVSTVQGLDFEAKKTHILVIGTIENNSTTTTSSNTNSYKLSNDNDKKDVVVKRFASVKIFVSVNDKNDNIPQLTNTPMPIRVRDSMLAGSLVAKFEAFDLDASEPNNKTIFSLVQQATNDNNNNYNNNYCATKFMIDSTSGELFVKSDLRSTIYDSTSECKLIVKVSDAGFPSLSSLNYLTIFIDHLADLSLSSQLAFAESSYSLEVDENNLHNSLIKILPIINKQQQTQQRLLSSSSSSSFISNNVDRFYAPFSCEIISGNELSIFNVSDNLNRDCELRVKAQNALDFETRRKFSLTIRLNVNQFSTTPTTSATAASTRTSNNNNNFITHNNNNHQNFAALSRSQICVVNVKVVDRNDNKPRFVIPTRYSHLTFGKLLAGVASSAPFETYVAQVKAIDADSPAANGLVSYKLIDEFSGTNTAAVVGDTSNNHDVGGHYVGESRFKIEPTTGIVVTASSFEEQQQQQQKQKPPFKLTIIARDNPELQAEALSSSVELIVNIINDVHRVVFAFKDTPTSRVLDSKEELLKIIQQRTSLVPLMERSEALKLMRNSSFDVDTSGTDFWVFFVDPSSLKIISTSDQRIKAAFFDDKAAKALASVIYETLGFNLLDIRQTFDFATTSELLAARHSASFARNQETQANAVAMLTLLAVLIGVFAVAALLCHCASHPSTPTPRNKHKSLSSSRQQQQQQQKNLNFSNNNALANNLKRPLQPPNFAFNNLSAELPLLNQYLAYGNSDLYAPSDLASSAYSKASASVVPNKNSNNNNNFLNSKLQQQHRLGTSGAFQQAPPLSIQQQQLQQTNMAKDYETQTHKLAVSHDDCQSVDSYRRPIQHKKL